MSLYKIIIISGPIAVGKSSVVSELIAEHGFKKISSGSYLADVAKKNGIEPSRPNLTKIGDKLDETTDFKWVITEILTPLLEKTSGQNFWVFDSVRKVRQVEHFKTEFGSNVFHVHFTASEKELKLRYEKRQAEGNTRDDNILYEDAILTDNEIESRSLNQHADKIINITSMKSSTAAQEILKDLV